MAVLVDLAAGSNVDYPALKRAGVTHVSRYVPPPDAQYDWKRLTRPEADRIAGAGLGLMLNFETSSAGAETGAAGGNVAADALLAAYALFPEAGHRSYCSNDTMDTEAQVFPFYQQVANRIGVDRNGYYGGEWVGLLLQQASIVSGVWAANASSWSGYPNWPAMRAGIDPRVCMIQHLDHPLPGIDPNSYDYNEVLRPDFLGGDMPVTAADVQAIADGVDAKLNAKVGMLQTNMKDIRDQLEAFIAAHEAAAGQALSDADIARIVAGVATFERRP
jgi:hypothetical protein